MTSRFSTAKSVLKSARFRLLIKLGLVVGLFYWLARKDLISLEATARAFRSPEHMLPAYGLLTLSMVLGITRWHRLLIAHGIRLSFSRVMQLSLVGNFFNIALPGAVSGDFVKAFYIGREVEGRRAHAFSAILFDRLCGVSALVLVSCGGLLAGFGSPLGSRLFFALEWILLASGAGVIAFFGYLFMVREHRDPLLRLFRGLEKRRPAFGSILRIYQGIRHYGGNRPAVAIAFALSITIHVVVVLTYLSLSRALGETVPLIGLFIVVPLGLLVTAVPVFPAGVGTGHAAFGYFLVLLGSQRGADLFSLFVLFQVVQGGIGGLVYLRFRAKAPAPHEFSGDGIPVHTS